MEQDPSAPDGVTQREPLVELLLNQAVAVAVGAMNGQAANRTVLAVMQRILITTVHAQADAGLWKPFQVDDARAFANLAVYVTPKPRSLLDGPGGVKLSVRWDFALTQLSYLATWEA